MVQNFSNEDKQSLFSVPIPQVTRSYKPVSHENIYNQVMEELDKHNLSVTNEKLIASKKGLQLIGYMDIKYGGNDELGMRLAYRNSYDKSMAVGFAAGANVWVCSNGMMGGELHFVKRHTSSVVRELSDQIVKSINELENHFLLMEVHSNRMKEIDLNKKATAELVGRMFMEEDLITSNQLSIIKKEFKESSHKEFSDPTLWSLYNHTTESFKQSHPMKYMQNHLNLHKFVEEEFSL